MKHSLQIILMGLEWDRLLHGLKEHPPTKAILLCPDPKVDPITRLGPRTIETTEKLAGKITPLIETEIVYVDFHDFDNCLEKLIEILEKNKDKFSEITLNISAGTKLLIAAATLASQYYPVKLFYVIPQYYTTQPKIDTLSKGVKGVVELPSFELNELVLPTKRQRELFLLIGDKISFTELAKRYCKEKGIKPSAEKIKEMKALLFYHLKKLKQKRLIGMGVEGRNLLISPTTTGKFILKVITARMQSREEQTRQAKLKLKREIR